MPPSQARPLTAQPNSAHPPSLERKARSQHRAHHSNGKRHLERIVQALQEVDASIPAKPAVHQGISGFLAARRSGTVQHHPESARQVHQSLAHNLTQFGYSARWLLGSRPNSGSKGSQPPCCSGSNKHSSLRWTAVTKIRSWNMAQSSPSLSTFVTTNHPDRFPHFGPPTTPITLSTGSRFGLSDILPHHSGPAVLPYES
jgi:hypothetical protein